MVKQVESIHAKFWWPIRSAKASVELANPNRWGEITLVAGPVNFLAKEATMSQSKSTTRKSLLNSLLPILVESS